MSQNFRVNSGNSQDLDLSFQTSTGGEYDLTGASVRWVMLRGEFDSSTAAVITKYSTAGSTDIEVTSSTGGTVTVHLKNSDTLGLRGVYFHEASVVTSTGGDVTMLSGYVTVTRAVL